MGAGLLGAVAGAGRGAQNIAKRMNTDRLREEDNAIWEARQVRLSEIRGQEADAAQTRADASESTRYARGRKDAQTDKIDAREYKQGLLEQKTLLDRGTAGHKASLDVMTDKEKIDHRLSRGLDAAGKAVAKGQWTQKEFEKQAGSAARTALGLEGDYGEWTEGKQQEYSRLMSETYKLWKADPSLGFTEAFDQVNRPEQGVAPPGGTAEPKAMDRAKSAAMEKMDDIQWLNTARAAAQRSPSRIIEIRGRLPEHLRSEFDQMTGSGIETIQR